MDEDLFFYEDKEGLFRWWNIHSISQINDWLFLGSQENASNLSLLKRLKITHILNVADDVENFFEGEFTYHNLYVKDHGQDQGIIRVFYSAFHFLERMKEKGEKVLVHCKQGRNRSATIVIAYLMKCEGYTLENAWEHVKENRPNMYILPDNKEALLALKSKPLLQ